MSTNLEAVTAQLARAGIPARVGTRPINRNVRGRIVEMAIDRDRRSGEALRISVPEDDPAELAVLGIDRDRQQAVLLVREPERAFVELVWDPARRKSVEVRRTTPPEKRHFLVGIDECHLFLAQLRVPVSSVKDAHRTLRPANLPAGKVRRQGEWFFVPATRDERERIAAHVEAHGVRRDVGIGARAGNRGRPHVVSESVLLPTPVLQEFVRGRVKHPDHRTITIHEWSRVVMNTENRTVGATWVD